MVWVKNVSPSDIAMRVERNRIVTIKRGQTLAVPLCYALQALVEQGMITLTQGGSIEPICGGLRYRKHRPQPLRSLDDDWVS